MKKKIIILGSTGSIGVETFNLIKKNKKNFTVKLLSTNKNIQQVYNQAKIFNVKHIIINDKSSYTKAIKIYKNTGINFYNSFTIIDKLFSKKEIFYSMISVAGLDGLDPTLRLIKYTNNIAIVNKEAIISGWNLISKKLKEYKTFFIPIDSEHFSIFSLNGSLKLNNVKNIYITASGGPFLNYDKSKIEKVNLHQALKHPNWSMGKKISIDSSTMINKLFEVIEAKKIFNLTYKKIKILIHPKSYVHAIIEYDDGLTKILIHESTMKIPIHNSIYLENHKKLKTKNINIKILNNLDFRSVDLKKFPLINILNILPEKDSLFETVLITVNDFFVTLFLNKKINYIQLIDYIKYYSKYRLFEKFKKIKPKNLNEIYKTRNYVNEKLINLSI